MQVQAHVLVQMLANGVSTGCSGVLLLFLRVRHLWYEVPLRVLSTGVHPLGLDLSAPFDAPVERDEICRAYFCAGTSSCGKTVFTQVPN